MEQAKDRIATEHRSYEPHGAAKDLLYFQGREVLIEGPAGTGKTRAILEKLYIVANKYPGCRLLIARKTRESLTESVLVTLEEKVLPVGHYAKSGAQRRMRQAYTLHNGSTIVIGGLDKPEKLFSTEFDIIAVFEATELTEDDWESLHRALRNDVVPYQQIIADCNPAYPRHWLNQRANAEKMTRLLSRHKDNPSLTPKYLETLNLLSGVRRDRLFLGKWAAAEGMVYEDWDAATHIKDRFEIPTNWLRFRVVDFGYTNPFCCQWWAVDDDGRAYRYREIYRTQTLVEDHARNISALTGGEEIENTVADHDAEDRATLLRYDIVTAPAEKAISTGIECVAARLRVQPDGKPRLFLMRDSLLQRDDRLADAGKPWCTEQEFDGYVYPKSQDGKPVKEKPVQVDDHGLDCVRYGMMWLDRYLYGGPPVYVDIQSPRKYEPTEESLKLDDMLTRRDEDIGEVKEELERAGLWQSAESNV